MNSELKKMTKKYSTMRRQNSKNYRLKMMARIAKILLNECYVKCFLRNIWNKKTPIHNSCETAKEKGTVLKKVFV